MTEYLYHISPFKFDILKPNTSEDYTNLLCACASPLSYLNLSYGFPKIYNGFTTTSLGPDYEFITYHEGETNIDLTEKSFIYVVNKSNFEEIPEKHEFISCEPVEYEYCLEISLKNYLVKIEKTIDTVTLGIDRKEKVIKLSNILIILNQINDIINEDVDLIKQKKKIFHLINQIIDNYDKFELESYLHDIFHSLKVIKNVIFIAKELNTKENILELIFAAGYHDCGKCLGFDEKGHGYHSFLLAKRFAPVDYDIDLIQKLIIFHDNEQLGKEDKDISIIRDADILDLPRCGIKINPNRMSHPEILGQILKI